MIDNKIDNQDRGLIGAGTLFHYDGSERNRFELVLFPSSIYWLSHRTYSFGTIIHRKNAVLVYAAVRRVFIFSNSRGFPFPNTIKVASSVLSRRVILHLLASFHQPKS